MFDPATDLASIDATYKLFSASFGLFVITTSDPEFIDKVKTGYAIGSYYCNILDAMEYEERNGSPYLEYEKYPEIDDYWKQAPIKPKLT